MTRIPIGQLEERTCKCGIKFKVLLTSPQKTCGRDICQPKKKKKRLPIEARSVFIPPSLIYKQRNKK
jgi:hypothetical protein